MEEGADRAHFFEGPGQPLSPSHAQAQGCPCGGIALARGALFAGWSPCPDPLCPFWPGKLAEPLGRAWGCPLHLYPVSLPPCLPPTRPSEPPGCTGRPGHSLALESSLFSRQKNSADFPPRLRRAGTLGPRLSPHAGVPDPLPLLISPSKACSSISPAGLADSSAQDRIFVREKSSAGWARRRLLEP